MSNSIEIPNDKKDGKDKELFKDPNSVFTIASPLSRHRRSVSNDNDFVAKRQSQTRGRYLKDFAPKYDSANHAATLLSGSPNTNGTGTNGDRVSLGSSLGASPPTFFPLPTPPGFKINGKEQPKSSTFPLQRTVDFQPIPPSSPKIVTPQSHKRPVPDPRGFPISSPSDTTSTSFSSLAPPEVDNRPTSPTTPPKTRRRLTGEATPPKSEPVHMPTRVEQTPTKGVRGRSLSDRAVHPPSNLFETPKVIFNPPPSPTPDKRRQRSSTYTVRYKPNINPFTPEGRNLKEPIKPEDTEYDVIHHKEEPSSTYVKQFEQLAMLGKGTYGEVYKCRNRVDGCLYAVKRTIRRAKGTRDRQNILREVYGLAAITDHSHVLQYYGAWEEDDHLYIQTEFCEGGSVQCNIVFTEAELLQVLTHIAKGLQHIHSLGLVHLDIKPENIYLKFVEGTGPRIFKIGDLGLMNAVNDGAKIFMEGDCKYLSRELLEDDMSCLPKSDIFSLGASIYELSRRRPLPTGGDEWRDIRDCLIECTPEYSQEFWELLKSMLHPDPYKRPSTEEILQNPLVTAGKDLYSHTVTCCPLQTALEASQQQVVQLRQQVAYLEAQLGASKKALLSPDMRPPNEPFPGVPSDLLNRMQL